MNLSPDTDIKFLHVPLSLDNKNQLTFSNAKAQANYFEDCMKFEYDNVSYLRENGIIRLNKNYDECYNINYVMYKNNTFPNKWFYAFIVDKTYVNENRTDIKIITDVFQTWQFDITFEDSFVEREMCDTSDDIPGNNLIPEGLETGETQIQDVVNISDLDPIAVVAFSGDKVMFSMGSGETTINQNGVILNGMPIACAFLYCEINAFPILIQSINNAGNGDKIVSAFTVPRLAISNFLTNDRKIGEVVGTEETYTIYAFMGSALGTITNKYKQDIKTITVFNTPSNLDGYTPHNKKLLTYPYCYFGINTPNSSQKIYRFEDFSSSSHQFNVMSEINPNPTVVLIPKNYRNNENYSMQDICAINGYPTLATVTDVFNTWLAQNSNIVNLQMQQEQYNYEVSAIKGGLDMASSMLTLGLSNDMSLITGISKSALDMQSLDKNHEFYIKNIMAQVERQSLLPDTVNLSSSNATLVGYGLIDNSIFNLYTIRREFAESIDNYFDMYGYATNKLKVPNINNRPNWNYVKTQGLNITGENISQEDIQTLKNMFDNGITLWHNTNNFLNYSANNR